VDEHREAVVSALTAPARLIGGFVAGAVVALVVFGLAWSSFWPSGLDRFGSFAVLLFVVAMVGASLGAGLFSVRPITRWWQLGLACLIGALLGFWAGRAFQPVLIADCLAGTDPPKRWCSDGYAFAGMLWISAGAGSLALVLLSALGVNSRDTIRERRRSAERAVTAGGEWGLAGRRRAEP
jgi:hypothetical protein